MTENSDYSFDSSPHRVWLGLTVPGKKMVRALGYSGVDVGRELIIMYQEMDLPAISYAVALVMEDILRPDGKAVLGPAIRDLTSDRLAPSTIFGAVLTDVRDFLKSKYRCKGLQIPAAEAVALVTSAAPDSESISSREPGWVVNLTVTALDALSRGDGSPAEFGRFRPAIRGLRDLNRAAHRRFGARSDGFFADKLDELEAMHFKETD